MKEKNSPTPQKTVSGVYTSELLQRQWLSKKAFEIELTKPSSFEFRPGQCICFIHETIERYYSLISTAADSTLKICIHYVENGVFSPLLSAAKLGTHLNFTGPHGYFTFQPSQRPPVFIATGTGIAPFLSIGRSSVAEFTLLHEVKALDDLYYESLFRSCVKSYVPCLVGASSDSPVPSNTFLGSAAGYLQKQLPLKRYDFYLCGGQEMIRDVTLLVDERFPGSLIFREVFY